MPMPGGQINRSTGTCAAAQFNEVDRQHPYSVWARRAMLMSAFCSYQANNYIPTPSPPPTSISRSIPAATRWPMPSI